MPYVHPFVAEVFLSEKVIYKFNFDFIADSIEKALQLQMIFKKGVESFLSFGYYDQSMI